MLLIHLHRVAKFHYNWCNCYCHLWSNKNLSYIPNRKYLGLIFLLQAHQLDHHHQNRCQLGLYRKYCIRLHQLNHHCQYQNLKDVSRISRSVYIIYIIFHHHPPTHRYRYQQIRDQFQYFRYLRKYLYLFQLHQVTYQNHCLGYLGQYQYLSRIHQLIHHHQHLSFRSLFPVGYHFQLQNRHHRKLLLR